MKTVLTFGLIALLIISCRKEEGVLYLESILAGQKSGDGIKYIDVIPDDTIAPSYNPGSKDQVLDINGDGIDDVTFRCEISTAAGFGYGECSITPIGSNEIVVQTDSSAYVDTLSLNVVIDQNMKWNIGTCLLYEYFYSENGGGQEGLWNDAKDKYIGVKIVKDDKIQYGWIKVNVMGAHLILFEYATTGEY